VTVRCGHFSNRVLPLCPPCLLYLGLQICVQPGPPPPLFPCFSQVQVRRDDTCKGLIGSFFADDPLGFYSLNPGIDCDRLPTASSNQPTMGKTIHSGLCSFCFILGLCGVLGLRES